MSITISLCLDEELVNQLEDIAQTTNCSKSHLIRAAVEQYVAEYDYQSALDRLNNVHDEIISSAQMRKLLANEG